jgi:hypothetical protein
VGAERPADLGGAAFHAWLSERVELATEPRAERYRELVAIVNGWPKPSPADTVREAYGWLYAGLRHLVTAEQESAADPRRPDAAALTRPPTPRRRRPDPTRDAPTPPP